MSYTINLNKHYINSFSDYNSAIDYAQNVLIANSDVFRDDYIEIFENKELIIKMTNSTLSYYKDI